MRWAVLAQLVAFALAYAVNARRRPTRLDVFAAAAAGFVALAFASTLWSSDASLTAGRAFTLLALVVTAGALAYGCAGRHEAAGQILLGVLAGVVMIAVAGIFNLWADADRALVPATRQSPTRYNGLGGNPNTMAMLLALALPLAAWALHQAHSRLGRAAAAGAFLLLVGSIVASGSRGALLAGFAGLLAFALAAARSSRLRLGLAGAIAGLLIIGAALMQLPQPAERDPDVLNPEFGKEVPLGPRDAQFKLPLENEIGFPAASAKPFRRSPFETSGRTQAWRGALDQAAERPLAGYGFGTEERVFVDRYYLFLSNRVENSYLGTVLQLGAAGLMVLLALLGTVLLRARRAVPRLQGPARAAASACLGVVVCGLVLGATQSFMTSVGSPPTAPFWLAAFLMGALGSAGRP